MLFDVVCCLMLCVVCCCLVVCCWLCVGRRSSLRCGMCVVVRRCLLWFVVCLGVQVIAFVDVVRVCCSLGVVGCWLPLLVVSC